VRGSPWPRRTAHRLALTCCYDRSASQHLRRPRGTMCPESALTKVEGLLLPKPLRQVLHYAAHPDRLARTVRQRPLGSPAEAARSPSVSPSLRRDRSGHGSRNHQLGRSVGWRLGQLGRTSIWAPAELVTVTDRFRPLLIAPCRSARLPFRSKRIGHPTSRHS
jgi:hypothetical protein